MASVQASVMFVFFFCIQGEQTGEAGIVLSNVKNHEVQEKLDRITTCSVCDNKNYNCKRYPEAARHVRHIAVNPVTLFYIVRTENPYGDDLNVLGMHSWFPKKHFQHSPGFFALILVFSNLQQ